MIQLRGKTLFSNRAFAKYLFWCGRVPFGVAGAWQPEGGLEFAVNRVGTVTDALFRLDVGDQVGIRGPLGNGFPMDLFKRKDILVLGGGIGGAPLRPIIQTIFNNRKDYGKVTILWAARTPACFLTENMIIGARNRSLDAYHRDQAPKLDAEVGLIPRCWKRLNRPSRIQLP